MGLVERLERLAKQLDAERWNAPNDYNLEAVDAADLLNEAARVLRGYANLVEDGRHALARH